MSVSVCFFITTHFHDFLVDSGLREVPGLMCIERFLIGKTVHA